MTTNKITVDRLREGPIDLGKGMILSAIMDEGGRISMLRFSHPTKDGRCNKIVHIKRRGIKNWRNNADAWSLFVAKDRSISLSPSIWCKEHDVHGTIRGGEWDNFNFPLSDMSQGLAEALIDRAIKRAEEFGGGYWGAILAMADNPTGGRSEAIRVRSDLGREDRQGRKQDRRSTGHRPGHNGSIQV